MGQMRLVIANMDIEELNTAEIGEAEAQSLPPRPKPKAAVRSLRVKPTLPSPSTRPKPRVWKNC